MSGFALTAQTGTNTNSPQGPEIEGLSEMELLLLYQCCTAVSAAAFARRYFPGSSLLQSLDNKLLLRRTSSRHGPVEVSSCFGHLSLLRWTSRGLLEIFRGVI